MMLETDSTTRPRSLYGSLVMARMRCQIQLSENITMPLANMPEPWASRPLGRIQAVICFLAQLFA
jgi:hypothetical protein